MPHDVYLSRTFGARNPGQSHVVSVASLSLEIHQVVWMNRTQKPTDDSLAGRWLWPCDLREVNTIQKAFRSPALNLDRGLRCRDHHVLCRSEPAFRQVTISHAVLDNVICVRTSWVPHLISSRRLYRAVEPYVTQPAAVDRNSAGRFRGCFAQPLPGPLKSCAQMS